MQREQTAAMIRMAEFMASGAPVGDIAGPSARCGHLASAAAFKNLGQMYVDDPRFAATYDQIAAGLAAYYRDALGADADTRLS